MAHPLQLGLQDAASPIMEELTRFHDHALMIVILVSTFVLYLIIMTISTNLTNMYTLDSQNIEIVWTLLPAFVLLMIALPSLRILYLMDELDNPHLTIKAIGHQWYWSYELTDYKSLCFDSYMTPTPSLTAGQLRLLEADHRMIIPTCSPVRVLVSAEDVLHSWTVPALGVKMDAVPGRLNQTSVNSNRPGVFYGQCSEICGANHSFMPVVIEALPLSHFELWSTSVLEEA